MKFVSDAYSVKNHVRFIINDFIVMQLKRRKYGINREYNKSI